MSGVVLVVGTDAVVAHLAEWVAPGTWDPFCSYVGKVAIDHEVTRSWDDSPLVDYGPGVLAAREVNHKRRWMRVYWDRTEHVSGPICRRCLANWRRHVAHVDEQLIAPR